MALLLLEGFEGAGTTTGTSGAATVRDYIKSRYAVNNAFRDSNTTESVKIFDGWGSGYALSWGGDANSDNNQFYFRLGAQYTELIVGFAYKPRYTREDNQTLLQFYQSDEKESQVDLRLYENRHLICFNDTFNRLSDSLIPNALAPDRWAYIEIRMVQHPSNGEIEIYVDGIQKLNITGQDTQGDSNIAYFDSVIFQGAEGASASDVSENVLIDDIYIVDTTGGAPLNTFLGPIKVEGLFPTAEGGTIDFTPSTGTDNSAMVDDNPKDDATTYNESTDTASNKDLFATSNLSTITGTIFGVQITAQAVSQQGFPVGLQCIVFENATQGTGNVIEVTTDNKFLSVQHIFDENPDTTSAWTVSEVNAMEIGYEVD